MGSKPQVLVIGLGPAGLAAAGVLGDLGLDVVLADENRRPGGQYLRRPADGFGPKGRSGRDAVTRAGRDLIEGLGRAGATRRIPGRVLSIEGDGAVWGLDDAGRIWEERAEAVILATGAREKFLPFPGWTLPGVVSTGGAQIMLKSCGMLPGHEPLIGGLGPLPLALAGDVLAAGGRVKAFWDQAGSAASRSAVFQMLGHPKKLAQGLGIFARLVLSGTKLLRGTKIVEAEGLGQVVRVTLARMDPRGRAVAGTEKSFETDCLAVGHGFVPNIELAILAGCGLEYDPDKGGWVTAVDENLRTSLPRIYAAGEVTGVAGAAKSLLEGRLAGLAAARDLGALDEKRFREMAEPLRRQRRVEMDFGRTLRTLCRPPAGFLDDLPDDLILCRCEDVTLGEVRRQVQNGFTTLDALKKSAQCGMGACQGRTCGPILADVLEVLAPGRPDERKPFTVRGPIKPVPLSALAAWGEQDAGGIKMGERPS